MMKFITGNKTVTLANTALGQAQGRTLPGFAVLSLAFLFSGLSFAQTPFDVVFKVDMTGVDARGGAYITGSFTGPEGQWYIAPMTDEGNGVYSYTASLDAGAEGAYYFLHADDWNSREKVPAACAEMWNVDRKYTIPEADITFAYKYGSCEGIGSD